MRFCDENALKYPRFHLGCSLTASDQLCLTLSCRSSVVSFRCEEAAPPASLRRRANSLLGCSAAYCCSDFTLPSLRQCYNTENAPLPARPVAAEHGPSAFGPERATRAAARTEVQCSHAHSCGTSLSPQQLSRTPTVWSSFTNLLSAL